MVHTWTWTSTPTSRRACFCGRDGVSLHPVDSPPTRVADDQHLAHLLDNAQAAVNRSDHMLAITHLSQAVLVASTKGTALSEFELVRRVKSIIDTGGRIA
jgi:hypothetical protein